MLKFPKITVLKISRYTIVEMMMVVAVFMIILSMAMVAWLNSSGDAKLKNAARLVKAQLDLARSKAIAERKPIGVYFAQDANSGNSIPYKFSMIVCEEGNHKKTIYGENWAKLPSETLISKNNNSCSQPDAVVFKSNGAKKSGPDTIYVLMGDQGTKSVANEGIYFEIKINEFSGRITTKYFE